MKSDGLIPVSARFAVFAALLFMLFATYATAAPTHEVRSYTYLNMPYFNDTTIPVKGITTDYDGKKVFWVSHMNFLEGSAFPHVSYIYCNDVNGAACYSENPFISITGSILTGIDIEIDKDSKKNVSIMATDAWNSIIYRIPLEKAINQEKMNQSDAIIFTGSPTPGFLDGPKENALFFGPADIALNSQGGFYVADAMNNAIRYYNPATGEVGTLIGGGNGYENNSQSPKDSLCDFPTGVSVFEKSGKEYVYFTDFHNHRVREITVENYTAVAIRTVGGPSEYLEPGIMGDPNRGSTDGHMNRDARFNHVSNVEVDQEGRLFISDWGNHRIRSVFEEEVTTEAGGVPGYVDGIGSQGQFFFPWALSTSKVLSDTTALYVTDVNNNVIRKIELEIDRPCNCYAEIDVLRPASGIGTIPFELSLSGQKSACQKKGCYITGYEWRITDPESNLYSENQTPGSNVTLSAGTWTSENILFDIANLPGQYTVELEILSNEGDKVKTNKKIVAETRDNRMPSCAVSANPLSGELTNQNSQINITASGALSNDPDGDTLSYSWKVFKVLDDESRQQYLENATSGVSYNFPITEPGSYLVELTVSDGEVSASCEQPDIKVEYVENRQPICSMTLNPGFGTINESNPTVGFTASGANSFDPDGDALTYSFELLKHDDGTDAVTSVQNQSSSSSDYNFSIAEAGTYDVKLTVSDGLLSSECYKKDINVDEQEAQPPVCVLNVDPKTAYVTGAGATAGFNADASISYDPDGSSISYLWEVFLYNDETKEPAETAMKTSTDALYSFNLAFGQYLLKLTVTDGVGLTSECTRDLQVTSGIDQPPVPIIRLTASDNVFSVNESIVVDGSLSYDPEGELDPNSFNWTCSHGLAEKTGDTWVIKIPDPGIYTIQFTVSDMGGQKATSKTITVEIRN